MKCRLYKTSLIIVALTFGVIFSGCGNERELSEYEKGIEALNSEQYTVALECFKGSEETGEDTQLIYRGEGLAYLGLGRYDEAIDAFNLALSKSNGIVKNIDYDINYYLAVAEYKSGKLENALATYTSIINIDKNNADAYYLRGKVNLELNKVDDAKADYDKAVELDKDDSKLYINIYDDLSGKGMETEAKAYISLGVANVTKPTKYELGIFNYYLGDYTQARNYFEEASETKKTEEGITYLGKTYVALDDSSYAIALYEEYAANNETAAIVYNELGLLKAANKDYEGALAAFDAGLKCEEQNCRQSLMFNQIVANEYLGNFSESKKQMEFYLTLYPDDKNAMRENVFLSTR